MTLRLTFALALLSSTLLAQGGPDPVETITAAEFLEHVTYLASDELAGRDTGSDGERLAREYAVKRFRDLGLQGGGVDGSFEQAFPCDGVTGTNVIAKLPGTTDECVVIGAHYDHVGMGHFGSTWGEKGAGHIHNGADDNASGTAAILEIAEAFAEGKVAPRRTILFMLFSGEERGLVGSKYFVENPTVPRESIAAMINLDMVGRGVGVGRFIVLGARTSPVFPELVDEVNARFGYDLDPLPFGFAPSDNNSFYEARIPVFFLTTGEHPQYHNPEDDVPLINEENGAATARFAFELGRRLADLEERPPFQMAELVPKGWIEGLQYLAKEALSGAHLGVTLGDGLTVASVVPGSAAEQAGIAAGDVLVSFDDVPLVSPDGLRSALRERSPGDHVTVVLHRGSTAVLLGVSLGKR